MDSGGAPEQQNHSLETPGSFPEPGIQMKEPETLLEVTNSPTIPDN